MSTSPTFASTPKCVYSRNTAACTARDGSDTDVALAMTGAAAGTIVERLIFHYEVTTTAGMLMIFLSTDGGTTKRIIDEIPVSAITPSGTVKAFHVEWPAPKGFVLPDTNAKLYWGTYNAEACVCHAFGADLT